MARRDSIQRINIIVNFLRKKPADFKEILSHLEKKSVEESYNYAISQKTFKRDLDLIASLLEVEIEYSHFLKKYKIVQEAENEINIRIAEAYDTFNALKLASDISQFIFFEKRKAIGTEHLSAILYAIKNRKMVRFSYLKYWESEAKKRIAIPLALKENKNRWYLIAFDENNGTIKTFGLDRISNLSVTESGFIYPEKMDVDLLFKNSFGIINDEDFEAQEVILAFTPFQAKYIKSLPLHASQEIIFENEKECHLKLFVQPTEDLIMEILSHGANVKVLEPESLKNEIKMRLKKSLNRY